jgi:O-methyltransferase
MAIYRRFRHFTMIPRGTYVTNLELADRFSSVSGSIVECGTWKGGMIAGIAKLLGRERHYCLFDSFEGLPPAKEIDGPAALEWQADTESPTYWENCRASEEDAKRAMALAGGQAVIVKGWFQETLSRATFPDGIAILRLDADWYQSTFDILHNLFHQVTSGGVVIIDDYYTWDGCSRAVHDYLSQHKRTERINSRRGVCFMVKAGT